MSDLKQRIKTIDHQSVMFVDEITDGQVWISIHHAHGSNFCVLTKDQAEELIHVLIKFVDISNAKN